MRPLFCLILAFTLAACASTPEPAPAPTQTAQAEVVCEKAAPTGSRLSRQICYTREQAAAAESDAKRMKDGFERTPRVEAGGRTR